MKVLAAIVGEKQDGKQKKLLLKFIQHGRHDVFKSFQTFADLR